MECEGVIGLKTTLPDSVAAVKQLLAAAGCAKELIYFSGVRPDGQCHACTHRRNLPRRSVPARPPLEDGSQHKNFVR
jgi:hypothetical protein